MLKTQDFDYNLPESLIAFSPAKKRDESRLLVLDRAKRSISHKKFFEILEFLKKGDTLVINDTKVIPARLIGKKRNAGGNAEILLLRKMLGNVWECLARPAKRIKKGAIIDFNDFSAEIVDELDFSRRAIRFLIEDEVEKYLDISGEVPLPPYITDRLTNKQKNDPKLLSRYQTVYASNPGASAAPTAGLHFTKELLAKISEAGVGIVSITLHTGAGTFIPVSTENVKDHKMYPEAYEIGDEAAEKINETKKNGGRVIAVGTTSVRCLEDCYGRHGSVKAFKGDAEIFIYPPHKITTLDAMITNFHFPRSTLLMLVSAFAGRDLVMKAYNEAIAKKYRFYSFGDAMMIL